MLEDLPQKAIEDILDGRRSPVLPIHVTDESGEVAYEQDAGSFTGSEEASFSVKNNLTEGKYDVYLRVYGEEAEGAPLYCLQFANDGLWNAELKANKIGSIEYSV